MTQGPNVTFWSGTSYTFKSAPDVPSLPQRIMVANFGTAQLDLASIAVSAPFAETDSCVANIEPGNSCNIYVTFTPTTTGTVQSTVAITDNAADSPQSVSLTGTGVAGMCFRKGANCTTSRQCCTGLHCVFNNNLLRPAYQCE